MKKNFIITGGQFKNKGSQAMVFAVVQELKKYHANSEIWMFTNQKNERSDIYNFNVLAWDSRLVIRLLLGKLMRLIKPSINYINEKKVDQLLRNTEAMFDVSGFALSSQLKFSSSMNFLLRIVLAKKYMCKIILLPQSFGPFNYKRTIHKIILFPLLRHYLKYPLAVYPREQQGFVEIKKFTNSNVTKALDLVLITDKPQKDVIYKKAPENLGSQVKNKTVAIIPNKRIINWNSKNDIKQIYRMIINGLFNEGYHVYLLRHSYEDLDFCKSIAAMFNDSQAISVLTEDYNCIDLSNIIAQMEFVIASRYHSLIHAYKADVPAIIIGWAQKYPELMYEFEQKQYFFDIREAIVLNTVEYALSNMMAKLNENKYLIKKQLENIKQESNLKHIFLHTQ